jgi:hypothetical protein
MLTVLNADVDAYEQVVAFRLSSKARLASATRILPLGVDLAKRMAFECPAVQLWLKRSKAFKISLF